jgi:hypothetical protein
MSKVTLEQTAKLESVSEMNLRYGYFEVDVSIAADGFGIESFPGIPLIDMAFCLLIAGRKIGLGKSASIGCTESDMSIHFAPNHGILTVERSWNSTLGHCGIDEFSTGVLKLCREVSDYISRRYPAFQRNSSWRKMEDMINGLSMP